MRNARILAVLAALLYLTGCASGAKMGNMVYDGQVKPYDAALQNNVDVTNVSGGEETNPAWTSEIDNNAFAGALKQTLQKQGLLAGSGRYQLEALLLEVDQPVFGLDFEVTTHVKYILTDRENNGAVVLNETIIAPYTATIGDAFAATACGWPTRDPEKPTFRAWLRNSLNCKSSPATSRWRNNFPGIQHFYKEAP